MTLLDLSLPLLQHLADLRTSRARQVVGYIKPGYALVEEHVNVLELAFRSLGLVAERPKGEV